jgi:hypothetical protein
VSYDKALRVVGVIAARHASAQARSALAEVASILAALKKIADDEVVPESAAELLAKADPKQLPAYILPSQEVLNQKRRREGWVSPHAWKPERREEVFDYIGQGNSIVAAAAHFEIRYTVIRRQILKYGSRDDVRLKHILWPGTRDRAA